MCGRTLNDYQFPVGRVCWDCDPVTAGFVPPLTYNQAAPAARVAQFKAAFEAGGCTAMPAVSAFLEERIAAGPLPPHVVARGAQLAVLAEARRIDDLAGR